MEVNTKTLTIVCALVFVFLLGFSLSLQAYALRQQELNSPVSQYLRENYGVNSIEEYRAKLEQELWLNYSMQLESLANEYPDLASELNSRLDSFKQFGASQPVSWFSVGEPSVMIEVFSLSGLGLVSMVAVPLIRKRKRLMQALILSVVVFCVFSIGYFVGTISAQTGTITIEPYSFQETASYIIFTDGTTVYAKNGRTGQIEFSGTDASTVIQSAINALTNGGRVLLKAGTYTLSKQIELKSGVTLEGEDKHRTVITGSRLFFTTDGLTDVVVRNLKVDNRGIGGCVWLAPPGGVTRWGPSNVLLEDLILYGSNSTTIGGATIEVRSAKNIIIRNCEIAYGGHNGIYIDSTGAGYEPNEIHIQNNYIHDNYDDAIDPNYVRRLFVTNNRIVNNELSCLSLEYDCEHVLFQGNLVEKGRWISVIDSKYVEIVGNKFHISFPGNYRIKNSMFVSIIGNFYWLAEIPITSSSSVSIIGNHFWNDKYNDVVIRVAGGVKGLVVKNNYFNTWSEANARTEYAHPIVMDTTDGANSDFSFEDNFIECFDSCKVKFTGSRGIVKGNVVDRRESFRYVDVFWDYDGTMTGTAGTAFTVGEQSGEATGIAIDSTGLKQVSITFPFQYPTGGAKPSFDVEVWLKNPTATDFNAIVWVDNITATGFRINVLVVSASATAGATVNVGWRTIVKW